MLCKVPPIRIGAACQPCTGREGLAVLANENLPSMHSDIQMWQPETMRALGFQLFNLSGENIDHIGHMGGIEGNIGQAQKSRSVWGI